MLCDWDPGLHAWRRGLRSRHPRLHAWRRGLRSRHPGLHAWRRGLRSKHLLPSSNCRGDVTSCFRLHCSDRLDPCTVSQNEHFFSLDGFPQGILRTNTKETKPDIQLLTQPGLLSTSQREGQVCLPRVSWMSFNEHTTLHTHVRMYTDKHNHTTTPTLHALRPLLTPHSRTPITPPTLCKHTTNYECSCHIRSIFYKPTCHRHVHVCIPRLALSRVPTRHPQ